MMLMLRARLVAVPTVSWSQTFSPDEYLQSDAFLGQDLFRVTQCMEFA